MILAQTHTVPSVYVSLGSTNYPVNNSHLLITALGQHNDQAMVCHVDNIRCCRGIDNDNPNDFIGSGEWLFPNGTAVQRSLDFQDSGGTSVFYRSRDFRLIRLHRDESVVTPTGSYCCQIPLRNDTDVVTFCIELGELLCQEYCISSYIVEIRVH